MHDDESNQHSDGKHGDRNERAARMQKKDHTDKCNNYAFLGQRVLECFDGTIDQLRSVIDRQNTDSLRQASSDLGDLFLEAVFAFEVAVEAFQPAAVPVLRSTARTSDEIVGSVSRTLPIAAVVSASRLLDS